MVNELDKVDYMALDEADPSRLILAISDHLDWRFEKEHLLLLQEKLNNYINYILNQEYKDTYTGELSSFQIRIYLQCAPRKKLDKMLSKFRKALEKQVPDVPIAIDYQTIADET